MTDINSISNIKNIYSKLYSYSDKPKKNNDFPIIAITISYNYCDTLQYYLKINHKHFKKILIVTMESDKNTINLCKLYDNIEIIYFDFFKNAKFNKNGGVKKAQKIAYQKYPNSWYLLIDSDIILPSNFIDTLKFSNLQEHVLYGTKVYNIKKISDLTNINNILQNNSRIANNILYIPKKPPSIMGCFQLYKKKNIFYNDSENCFGNSIVPEDYKFGYNNFNIFCSLENNFVFHLGNPCQNWNGKMEDFINDKQIEDKYLFFKIDISHNILKYYNRNKILQKIKSNSIINKKYKSKKWKIIITDSKVSTRLGYGKYIIINHNNFIMKIKNKYFFCEIIGKKLKITNWQNKNESIAFLC